MSLFRRRRDETEQRSSLPSVTSLDDLVSLVRSAQVTPQSAATLNTALHHPTVYQAVNKISGLVAQMPWFVMAGGREIPLPSLLAAPSPGMHRPSSWRRAAASSMLLAGGAYGFVDGQRPTRIDLIHPDDVEWSASRGWTVQDDEVDEWPVGPLWQVPLLTLPGSPKGVNPIEHARRTTFTGLAAIEFGGNYFRDGAHPTTIIAPEKEPTPEQAALLKKRIRGALSGNREPLVLPSTVKWHQMQALPEDSQFIETMGFTSGQVAGFFGLRPEDLGLPVQGSAMTYSNRENRQQDLLQNAVNPVIVPLKEALSELITRGHEVKFNTAGLLRSDLAARYASYKTAAEISSLTGETFLGVDEMRELENRAPYEGGDDG